MSKFFNKPNKDNESTTAEPEIESSDDVTPAPVEHATSESVTSGTEPTPWASDTGAPPPPPLPGAPIPVVGPPPSPPDANGAPPIPTAAPPIPSGAPPAATGAPPAVPPPDAPPPASPPPRTSPPAERPQVSIKSETDTPETFPAERRAEHVALEQVLYEVKKVIVGQDLLLEQLIVALLARGHVLVEGVPGLAKTLAIKTLADTIGGEFQRIQFTPDLVPADLTGTRIYNQKSGEFQTSLGPVFTNLLLADEINRAPAKVQSALLEVMQERQVTIGRETHEVPQPFLVLATQNPIESEGTYPLPEAQLDRFMMKVLVDYPSPTEEFVIVERMTSSVEEIARVITPEQLLALQDAADEVYVDPALIDYAVQLVNGTRNPGMLGLFNLAPYITHGASPRASINLILTAKALAFVRGRNYCLAHDVRDLALDVLRHRLVLSYEALADDVRPDDLLAQILAAVPLPEVTLNERTNTILSQA